MNRQKLILFVLLILLVLAVFWSFTRLPRQATVSTLKYAPGQQASAPRPTSPVDAAFSNQSGGRTLRLDLLVQERQGFKGYRRNIFKPVFVDELKLIKLQSAAIRPAALPPLQPVKIVPAQPPVVAAPLRELVRFTFLGFLQKENRTTIFLSRDKDIFLVRKGDTFGGRFMATAISDQALTIKVNDSAEEIVIPLIENMALRAAR
jgi:hypothetical protein